MFWTPTGINIETIKQGLDGKLMDVVAKVDWMTRNRKEELLPLITDQYDNV